MSPPPPTQTPEKQQEYEVGGAVSARGILEETGLAIALPAIWSKLSKDVFFDYAEQDNQYDLKSHFLDRTVSEKGSVTKVSWLWVGRKYELRLNDYNDLADLFLFVDGGLVARISLVLSSSSPAGYEYLTVDSLEVGPWVHDVIQMQGLLERA